jgi:hypothetical protein
MTEFSSTYKPTPEDLSHAIRRTGQLKIEYGLLAYRLAKKLWAEKDETTKKSLQAARAHNRFSELYWWGFRDGLLRQRDGLELPEKASQAYGSRGQFETLYRSWYLDRTWYAAGLHDGYYFDEYFESSDDDANLMWIQELRLAQFGERPERIGPPTMKGFPKRDIYWEDETADDEA